MMNFYDELIEKVVDASNELNIDTMLIGAYARDYWREFFKINVPVRTTMDIDFACQVIAWEDYKKLFELLKTKFDLLPDPGKKHTLWLRNDISLDLIPFGGIADNNGEISWPPDFDTSLSVLGYEAAKYDAELVHIGKRSIKIIKPYWLALLKLQSYTGNVDRTKDLTDFYFLVDNYFDCINEEDRMFKPNGRDTDVLQCENFDTRIVSATLIARDCLRSDEAVAVRIMSNLGEYNKDYALTIALASEISALSTELSQEILDAVTREYINFRQEL